MLSQMTFIAVELFLGYLIDCAIALPLSGARSFRNVLWGFRFSKVTST